MGPGTGGRHYQQHSQVRLCDYVDRVCACVCVCGVCLFMCTYKRMCIWYICMCESMCKRMFASVDMHIRTHVWTFIRVYVSIASSSTY